MGGTILHTGKALGALSWLTQLLSPGCWPGEFPTW